ncbi:MAG: hypothetical protein ABFS39_11625 [Pseudomonadota bacterium]
MKPLVVEKTVQQAVDRLLLEQGSYTPLELLLMEGRLLFADYEAWRSGQCRYLDELLFGDPEQSRDLLQQAAAYVEALKLEAEPISYNRWGGGGGDLPFSPQSGFDRLFHTTYGKPAEIPQMDLFMDATGATLVNGIQAALIGRDFAEARRQLDLLFDADPGNNRLGSLEQLVEASGRLNQSVVDVVAGELDYLQQELLPLAADQLGAGSRDFLAPFWRRLIQAVWADDFNPERPELHASYMAIQVEAWEQVQQSIEAQADWAKQPLLVRRYAQASGRLQQSERAVCCWFRLCWGFPDQTGAIGREAESDLRHRWQCFVDLESELPNQDFPAWSLLEQPGLIKRLAAADCLADVKIPEDYRVTAELAAAGVAAVPAADLIEQRKRLKELNPELFRHYLKRFGRG